MLLQYLKLFETCIRPILLYCSELICLDIVIREDTDIENRCSSYLPEKIQIKFAKMVLDVNRSAVNSAVLAELGLLPLSIQALKHAVGYWHHIFQINEQSIVKNAYIDSKCTKKAFAKILSYSFKKINFTHVFENESTFNIKALMRAVFRVLNERFINFWYTNMHNDDNNPNGNKLRTYRKIKDSYELESYLLTDIDKTAVSIFTKIRISNSKLLIEEGRHYKIPLEQRLCKLCKVEIKGEIHFVLKCDRLAPERSKMIENIYQSSTIFNLLEEISKFILSSNDHDINRICIF